MAEVVKSKLTEPKLTTITPADLAQQVTGKSHKPIAVDIRNHLPGKRIIWNGIVPRGEHVVIESGETKYNVQLAEWVVKELRAHHRAEPSKEVRLYDAGKAPKPDGASEASGDEDIDDGE